MEKVKEGKVKSFASAGFGGKGLDKLDKERDAKEKAQRSAYGEADEKAAVKEEEGVKTEAAEGPLPFEFKVEIKRGPAPDTSKGVGLAAPKAGEKSAKAEPNKDATAFERAQSVIAKLNAQVKATKLAMQGQSSTDDAAGRKPKDPDATDFHAIIPINDYPQKARWRVTNKETMVQVSFRLWSRMSFIHAKSLTCSWSTSREHPSPTRASITNREKSPARISLQNYICLSSQTTSSG